MNPLVTEARALCEGLGDGERWSFDGLIDALKANSVLVNRSRTLLPEMAAEIERLESKAQFLTEAYDRNAKVHEALTLDYLALKAELERVAPFLATHKACGYSFQEFQGKAEALAAMKGDAHAIDMPHP